MDLYRFIRPGRTQNFDEACASVMEQINSLPATPAFIKFFCSDAQNQAAKLRASV